MKITPIRKIGITLILIIFIPILFVSLYQLSIQSETEKSINSVYSNQIESVLFSINQYNEDLTSQWRSQLDNLLLYNTSKENNVLIPQYLKKNNIFISFSICDTSLSNITTYIHSGITTNNNNLLNKLKANKYLISKLINYKQNNYYKIEPLQNDNNTYFIFLSESAFNTHICILNINNQSFIKKVVALQLLRSTGKEFIISIKDKKANKIVYSTFYSKKTSPPESIKNLWLLPNYEIGISLKGTTIKELTAKRGRIFFVIIICMIILVTVGIYFIYKSARKEIELAQIKADFVSNVSHELRTPLALISMYSETLELGRIKDDIKKEEYIKIISNETARLSRLVNSILNFSKLESGKRVFNFTKVDLSELLNEVCISFEHKLNELNFQVDKSFNSTNVFINGDKEALKECFINLIDNAIKYSGNSKKIAIKTGINKDINFVEITDFGIGISEENQKRIFEKFYRVSTGDVHNTKGTGLGLAIVKQIIDYHKGKILVFSKLNEGTTFRLNFPLIK